MSKRLSRIALVVFGLGLFGVLALAIAGCGGHQYAEKHPERAYRYVSYRVDSVLDDLEATEQQRAEVHGVKDRVYDDIKAFGEHTKKSGRSAFAELKKDSPDKKKLHAMVDERMDEMR